MVNKGIKTMKQKLKWQMDFEIGLSVKIQRI